MDPSNDVRSSAFLRLQKRLLENYKIELRPASGDTLIVLMSPSPNFILGKYRFRHSVVCMADSRLTYYTHNAMRQCRHMINFAREGGFRTVLFLGSSKGGLGALLWASIAFRREKGIRIKCLSFSPQTQIYPMNEHMIHLPSYQRMISRLDTESLYAAGIRKYGNVAERVTASRLAATVVYSSGNAMDAAEAFRLASAPNIFLYPVDLKFHGSMLAFTSKIGDEFRLRKLVNKLYANAKTDLDLARSLPESREELADILRKVSGLSLNKMIEIELKGRSKSLRSHFSNLAHLGRMTIKRLRDRISLVAVK